MTSRPHVLLVNPNTNEQTTREMTALVRPILGDAGYGVLGVNVTAGPSLLSTPELLAASVPHVVECVRRHLSDSTVAVIVAAIGDPGVDELRETVTVPVIGIGESAIRTANDLGIPYGMITTTPLLGPGLLALVERYGTPGAFTGIRYTASSGAELADDRSRQLAELEAAARESVQDDGASAVIVGGGPLGDAARRLAERTASTFVEPLPSAARRTIAAIGAATGEPALR